MSATEEWKAVFFKIRNGTTFGLANHQHPVASVREGERWMKNVYEALRNGPQWEQTLLLITYKPNV